MLYRPLRYDKSKAVLLETDFCWDVDDVGALSLLLTAARRHGFRVAGISVNCPRPESAAAIAAILKVHGMSQVPVGLSAEAGPDASPYLALLADWITAEERAALAPLDSRELYQMVLEDTPDQSLTVISIGFFNVLDQVWRKWPELFERKVDTVIAMAGSFLFESGYREFNIAHAYAEAAADFIDHYPGRMIFSGFEVGYDVFTDLSSKRGLNHPVMVAYQAFNAANQPGAPSWQRPSWDPCAVDFAVNGEGARYRLGPNSDIRVVDGVTVFCEAPTASRAFVIQNLDSQSLGEYISGSILEGIS